MRVSKHEQGSLFSVAAGSDARPYQVCPECQVNRAMTIYYSPAGRWYFYACTSCRRGGGNRGRRYVQDTCEHCGYVPLLGRIELEVDHIVPKSQGGKHGRENLQTLCARCHKVKTLVDQGHEVPAPDPLASAYAWEFA